MVSVFVTRLIESCVPKSWPKGFSRSFFLSTLRNKMGGRGRGCFRGYCCSLVRRWASGTSYFIVEASLIFRLSGPPKSLENKKKRKISLFSVFWTKNFTFALEIWPFLKMLNFCRQVDITNSSPNVVYGT